MELSQDLVYKYANEVLDHCEENKIFLAKQWNFYLKLKQSFKNKGLNLKLWRKSQVELKNNLEIESYYDFIYKIIDMKYYIIYYDLKIKEFNCIGYDDKNYFLSKLAHYEALNEMIILSNSII